MQTLIYPELPSAYEALITAYIFLHQKRLKQIDNSDKLVEWSTPQVFFMAPHKNYPSLWLSHFPP